MRKQQELNKGGWLRTTFNLMAFYCEYDKEKMLQHIREEKESKRFNSFMTHRFCKWINTYSKQLDKAKKEFFEESEEE